jgi:predicted house-cleaning noncanonical NTP pyrophosphatase (MazG superfamily)/mannose-6-phosphate isomerase-like protein (cupin superfamily)
MTQKGSKVVRDRIPGILKLSGKECTVRELSDISFLSELEHKLKEEIEEYLESKELEELADLLEVIYRIAELRSSSKDALEALRLRKKQEKGGFEKNLLLSSPIEESCSLSEANPPTSEKSNRVVFRHEGAEVIEKHGVTMRIYTTKADCENATVLYQETETGHLEEFFHEKSDFIYYILEGKGTWMVDDREFEVRAGDVVVVPSGKRFWFRGSLKQICVTAPAWEKQYEHHIRDLAL